MRNYGSLAAAALVVVVALSVGVATAAAGGGNSANAKLCQKDGWQTIFTSTGQQFSSEEDCVSYGAEGGTYSTTPAATLVLTPSPHDCGGISCWGHVTATGLAPNASIAVCIQSAGGCGALATADANGNFDADVSLSCSLGAGIYVESTTASNQPITSNVVQTPPCA